jgi:hypothetical protein
MGFPVSRGEDKKKPVFEDKTGLVWFARTMIYEGN